MRMFWSAFFLGSMLLIGLDLRDRRLSPERSTLSAPAADGDPVGVPTPRPELP
jgi:hypothetical protein